MAHAAQSSGGWPQDALVEDGAARLLNLHGAGGAA